MSSNATQPTQVDPLDFINALEHPKRKQDALALLALFNRVTGLTPTMWGPSIIGYGSYTYTLANGKQEKMLRTGFSARKQNMVLYIMAGFQQQAELQAKLGKHKAGKSCLYVNKLEDVDLQVVEAMLKADMQVMAERYPE